MNSDDIFTFLDEIPIDSESEAGDISDDEEREKPTYNLQSPTLFDIDNMPIDFVDNIRDLQNNDDDWDSEDELSLAAIRLRELANKKTEWTKSNNYCLRNQKQFGEECGPNIPSEIESPVDIFLHLFPESLIEDIAFQTNLYALQKYGNPSAFKSTCRQEIKTFFAVNIMMGIKRLPSYRDYWSSRPELRDNFISETMSRDRFIWLLGHLHLNDNSVMPVRDSPNFDKLYKIRPVIDKLSETYMNSYKPSKHQSIDESMIRFKGRSSLKQYMPQKPIKRGYKVWVRSDESGYVCQFQIYTGKVGDTSEKSLGGRVIVDLTRVLVGKGYHIFFDNYFNSVSIQKQLQSELIYACGTVRRTRKDLPDDVKEDKLLKRGESEWRVSKDGIVYLKWKDRKGVHFLSNYSDPAEISTAKRKQKDGTLEEITCPYHVVNYNRHMGYVDKMDMLKSAYEIDRKSKKWWHRILWHFIDVTIVNSYIIFKNRSKNTNVLSLKLFRIAIVLGLIGSKGNLPRKGRPPSLPCYKINVPVEIRFDSCTHMPLHSTSRRCALCTERGETHRTRWMCTR